MDQEEEEGTWAGVLREGLMKDLEGMLGFG